MLACVVFEEERAQALVEFAHCFVAADEDVVILHRAPEPLDHDVVQGSAFAIHADADPMAFQYSGEGVAGVLAALVGVEDPGLPFGLQSFFQAFDAERGVQAVAELPADHITARPIDHSCQVDMAVSQRDVGDVRAPDLVAAFDLKPSEQVRVLLVPLGRRTQTRLWIDRFNPHDPHQSPAPVTPQFIAQQFEFIEHAATPISRFIEINPVDRLHDQLVFQAHLALRFMVIA